MQKIPVNCQVKRQFGSIAMPDSKSGVGIFRDKLLTHHSSHAQRTIDQIASPRTSFFQTQALFTPKDVEQEKNEGKFVYKSQPRKVELILNGMLRGNGKLSGV